MRVLALDAATEACSVALEVDGQMIERTHLAGKAHSETILNMVSELLAEAGLQLRALDGIAASIGPGAFTGVRISVAVAQGLAFGAGVPVVALSTLEALALQALELPLPRALSCLDARMGEVYWGCFAADPLRGVAGQEGRTFVKRHGRVRNTQGQIVARAANLGRLRRGIGVASGMGELQYLGAELRPLRLEFLMRAGGRGAAVRFDQPQAAAAQAQSEKRLTERQAARCRKSPSCTWLPTPSRVVGRVVAAVIRRPSIRWSAAARPARSLTRSPTTSPADPLPPAWR